MKEFANSLWRGSFLIVALAFSMIIVVPGYQSAAVAQNGNTDQNAPSTVIELEKQIEERAKEIKRLEEIAQTYRDTIATTQEQAATLKNDIARINRTVLKLQSEIRVIEGRIKKTNLEIKSLGLQISDTEIDISRKREHLAELVRTLSNLDSQHPVEALLEYVRFSDLFNHFEAVTNLEENLGGSVKELRLLRESLNEKKAFSEIKAADLKRYAASLGDKQRLQVIQQQERGRVLSETQNQEKKYQELLAETERKRKALQDEIDAYERTLRFTLDPNALPQSRSGILQWPVSMLNKSLTQCNRTVWAFLTQCFGNTAFSMAGGYAGKGHNGIDIRASNGTEILSAESGTVRGVGDTDEVCRRASYGKWILIDHGNNLTTLYAHLSLVKVLPGQAVSRGELIGYSGNSGYATGPHLHFSVFAHEAVEIGNLKSKVCGRIMTLPLSPFNGYLDPLNYL
ncbi:MAG: Peptidase, M23/M37 family [Parcubacteria group bacterium GW2011_GWA1_51_12]|nr:MAG: Peptidase, M23/M37 family [Parcubacteria group bacterium GW2011_GWA1_51_12]